MPKLLIPKPYKKVIDSSAVTQKGLIDIHKIDNKYLFEVSDSILIFPGGRALIPTNIRVNIPKGFEIQIRPRSGLALKHGISVLNTPGTIDSDYTGQIGVILINFSDEVFSVQQGDRIAQAVLNKVSLIEWEEVSALTITKRGDGGFGHTGVRQMPNQG